MATRCRHPDDSHYDLEPGDFVLLAPRVDHKVSSQDAGGAQTLLLCGYNRLDAIETRLMPDGFATFDTV